MPTDTNVNSLVINKLTKAQYDDIQSPSETELYLVEESIDTTPTSGSDNPVSSGGVYTALSNKIDKSSTSGLVKNDGTIDTSTYLTSSTAHQVPSGGNSGQVLKKSSATDYDYAWANQTQDYPSAYCTTAAGTAAKKASCSLYQAQANSYLHVLIGAANTSAGAITLNVNSAGAKPIYINGEASSSTNYTLPNGSYIVFYDGTNYYFRTDGKIQASATTVLANLSEVVQLSNDSGTGIVPEDGIRAETVAAGATISVNPDVVTVIAGDVGTATITFVVPDDSLAHVWDIFFSTDSTVSITFAMSENGCTIYSPSGFSAVGASKNVEVSVVGVGTKYYLRYGEFA